MSESDLIEPPGKWRHLGLLAVVELLAMTLWFSATAVVPQLDAAWRLSGSEASWLTMSVQLGFVVGALVSAFFNLPDRVSLPSLIGWSAILGALANGLIPWLEPEVWGVIALRFATGVCAAGVYPPGMKLAATWSRGGRGLAIGILVGALTLGSAGPHLINAFPFLSQDGMPPWRSVLWATSAMALVAGLLGLALVRTGPLLATSAPFDWRFASNALRHRPTRLANLGYLGHMWELYAMWTWVPLFLLESYRAGGLSLQAGRAAGFAVVGIGALGCVIAGALADRLGRTTVTSASMIVSGSCALVAGLLFSHPVLLTAVCLLWGFAVIADSAQFSAAVSELSDPRYVGTALTVQTCLGFLLTLATIRLVAALHGQLGWWSVFALLALGPLVGTAAMLRLRSLPEARAMASGRR